MATNGRLDVNTLTKVPLSAGGFGYLENGTAQGWFAAREDLIRTTGTIPIIISDGLYRDYPRQVYWKTYWTRLGKPENAATPGTSNHGLALCVDINNISAYNQKTLDTVMARHGFVRDTSETWHYHHTSTNPADSGSTPIAPEEEKKDDDMKALQLNGIDYGIAPGFIVSSPGPLYTAALNSTYGASQVVNGDQMNAELTMHGIPWGALAGITGAGNFGKYWSLAETKVAASTASILTALNGATPGSFTATDRAMLDDIANKAELSSALTNTVNLVNSHADTNKAQIIQEIDTHSGSSLSAFTATITPVE